MATGGGGVGGGGGKQQFTVYQARDGVFQIIFKSGLKRRAKPHFQPLHCFPRNLILFSLFYQVHKIYDKNSALESVNVIWCGPTDSG